MYTSDWRRLAMRGPSNGDSSSLLSPIVAEKKFAWISSVSNRLSYDMHHQSICEKNRKTPCARVRKHVCKPPFCWAVLTWGVPTLIFENWDVQLWEKLVPSSHEGSKWTLPCRCKVQTRNIGGLYICKSYIYVRGVIALNTDCLYRYRYLSFLKSISNDIMSNFNDNSNEAEAFILILRASIHKKRVSSGNFPPR